MDYSFSAKVWKYEGPAGWYFVTLPKLLSKKISINHGLDEEGWGRLKAVATIDNTTWKTAIWRDTKIGSYILPIKASVRRIQKIKTNSKVRIQLELKD